MLHSLLATGGMVTTPHHLASEAGLTVLREGGNAVEATLAAAAAIAVVYPHMNSIGGDGFWLLHAPGGEAIAIEACGTAGRRVTPALYREQGLETIPARGPLAANTVPATVSGWALALEAAAEMGGRLPLARLLEPAIEYAEKGVPVAASFAETLEEKVAELAPQPGFAETFLDSGQTLRRGAIYRQPAIARCLRRLAEAGADDFYRGSLARELAADLAAVGSPLGLEDLEGYRARRVPPLSLRVGDARVYNQPPPTQGLASLLILALYQRMPAAQADGFDHLHRLVECTKQAFLVRDHIITDPEQLPEPPENYLTEAWLTRTAAAVDRGKALAWPQSGGPGDTVWLGAVDSAGRAVSFIQSLYWEFGSGVVLPQSGILMQNRGASFELKPDALRALAPGRKPFHTLNAPLALFEDGRTMTYGCMGGEGQPQTQAAIFTRVASYGQDPQRAVTAPRWLLGHTWGDPVPALRLEGRFEAAVIEALREAGHPVMVIEDFSEQMGHAGMIQRYPNGVMEGAADPRSDGLVAAF